jgi:hypothetical protein
MTSISPTIASTAAGDHEHEQREDPRDPPDAGRRSRPLVRENRRDQQQHHSDDELSHASIPPVDRRAADPLAVRAIPTRRRRPSRPPACPPRAPAPAATRSHLAAVVVEQRHHAGLLPHRVARRRDTRHPTPLPHVMHR